MELKVRLERDAHDENVITFVSDDTIIGKFHNVYYAKIFFDAILKEDANYV